MMRFFSLLLVCLPFFGTSQTTLWIDGFENSCASGCTTYTGWTFVASPASPAGLCGYTSPNGASSNRWYVSCTEDGKANGVCGSSCTSNETLHMGSVTLGDAGAAYDASQTTCKMAQSPNINTVAAGTYTLTLSFEHIRFGQGTTDCAQLLYSIDGGSTWLYLANPIPTVTCCTGACSGQDQGVWATLNYTLPATCNNITTLKIGFNWKNNASGGSDPSFAVNDVRITYNPVLPVELLSFNAYRKQGVAKLQWQTGSEQNNAFFEVERSLDGETFKKIIRVNGKGTTSQLSEYSYDDKTAPLGKLYYRLKQVDFDGKTTFSQTVVLHEGDSDVKGVKATYTDNKIHVSIHALEQESVTVQLLDLTGKRIISKNYTLQSGLNGLDLDASTLSSGAYVVYVMDKMGQAYSISSKVVVSK